MAVRPAGRSDGSAIGLISFAILSVIGIGLFIWQLTVNGDLKTRADSAEKRARQFGSPPGYYGDEATGRGSTVADVMAGHLHEMANLVTGKKDSVWPGVKAESDLLLADISKKSNKVVAEGDTLLTAMRKLHTAYEQMTALKNQLQTERDELASSNQSLIEGTSAARKEFEDQIAAVKADLERIEQEKNDALASKDKQLTEQVAMSEAQSAELNAARVDRQAADRQNEIALERARLQTSDLQKKVQELKPTGFNPADILAKADGRVLRAIPGSDVVYIDIGSNEKVRPGMAFRVFSPTGERAVDEFGKASIEVSAVNAGTAEARVTRTIAGKPILEGDAIVNIAYERGRKTKFVIRGEFDLNYDGETDYDGVEKLTALIRDWGGQVVQNVDETVDFVVIGVGPQSPRQLAGRPTSAIVEDLSAVRASQREEWAAVIQGAAQRNIPVITQSQFLYLTGNSAFQMADARR